MIEETEDELRYRENPCEHEFARHVGVKVFNNKGMAWVQLSLVIGSENLPEMWICVHCGEEGYEVPA